MYQILHWIVLSHCFHHPFRQCLTLLLKPCSVETCLTCHSRENCSWSPARLKLIFREQIYIMQLRPIRQKFQKHKLYFEETQQPICNALHRYKTSLGPPVSYTCFNKDQLGLKNCPLFLHKNN